MGLEAFYKDENGDEFLKIRDMRDKRDRYLYYVQLSSNGELKDIISEVQEFQNQKKHFEENKRKFQLQKIFLVQDDDIPEQIDDVNLEINGLSFLSGWRNINGNLIKLPFDWKRYSS